MSWRRHLCDPIRFYEIRKWHGNYHAHQQCKALLTAVTKLKCNVLPWSLKSSFVMMILFATVFWTQIEVNAITDLPWAYSWDLARLVSRLILFIFFSVYFHHHCWRRGVFRQSFSSRGKLILVVAPYLFSSRATYSLVTPYIVNPGLGLNETNGRHSYLTGLSCQLCCEARPEY